MRSFVLAAISALGLATLTGLPAAAEGPPDSPPPDQRPAATASDRFSLSTASTRCGPSSARSRFHLAAPAVEVVSPSGRFSLAAPTAKGASGCCGCAAGAIFSDGFESGDTTAWAATSP